MWRCPVCEKEHTQGLVCDNCGFDLSRDYEQNRTLCSIVPRHTEPISVYKVKWRQKQTDTSAPGTLVCPKCGGTRFSILTNDQKFVCADCGTNIPITLPAGTDKEEPQPPVEPEEPFLPTAPEEPFLPTAPEEPPPPIAPEDPPPPAAPPEDVKKKGGWWKNLYLYEKVLVFCLLALPLLDMKHGQYKQDYLLRGLMFIPLFLSFAVTKNKVRKNRPTLSTILMIVVWIFIGMLCTELDSKAQLMNELQTTPSLESMVRYAWVRHLYTEQSILATAALPLLFRMFAHWNLEDKTPPAPVQRKTEKSEQTSGGFLLGLFLGLIGVGFLLTGLFFIVVLAAFVVDFFLGTSLVSTISSLSSYSPF